MCLKNSKKLAPVFRLLSWQHKTGFLQNKLYTPHYVDGRLFFRLFTFHFQRMKWPGCVFFPKTNRYCFENPSLPGTVGPFWKNRQKNYFGATFDLPIPPLTNMLPALFNDLFSFSFGLQIKINRNAKKVALNNPL